MPYLAPLPIFVGATPGRLDPNQQSRVLHLQDSTLSFATISPFAAKAALDNARHDDLDDSAIEDEFLGGRRVVIETSTSGSSICRFVPRPHFLHGVQNEGIFPREVIYCGMHVVLSQEQWDIHKLDSAFICTVHPDPHPPTIEANPSYFRAGDRGRPATHARNGSVSLMSIDDFYPSMVEQYSYESQADPGSLFTEPEKYSSEKCSSEPPRRKRKLSPETITGAWSSESTETPERYLAVDSQTPEKDVNPQVRAFAKAFKKRKEERMKQMKARRREQLLRQMAEMAEIARQTEQQTPKRKHTKPIEKGSDYMSWTETPLWTPEDVLPSTANPFEQNNQNHTPQPFFNPYFTGPPPDPQPFSTQQFEFTFFPGYPSQPEFTSYTASMPQGCINDQFDPSCNEEQDDTSQPECIPTPKGTPEPDTSRHVHWQSGPFLSDYEDHRRAALLESMQKIREPEKGKPIWEAEAVPKRSRKKKKLGNKLRTMLGL